MRTSAQHRDTRFELRQLLQGPNGYALVCVERDPVRDANGNAPPIPPLEISDATLSQDENDVAIAFFTLLENKFATTYDGHINDPARLKELVNDAVLAKAEADQARKDAQVASLEAQRIEIENIAKRAEAADLDAAIAAKQAALAATAASTDATAEAPGTPAKTAD